MLKSIGNALKGIILILILSCTPKDPGQANQSYFDFNQTILTKKYLAISKSNKGYARVTEETNQIIVETIQNDTLYERLIFPILNGKVIGNWSNPHFYEKRVFFRRYKLDFQKDELLLQPYGYLNEIEINDTLKCEILFSPDGLSKASYQTYDQKKSIIQRSEIHIFTSAYSILTTKFNEIKVLNGRMISKVDSLFQSKTINR